MFGKIKWNIAWSERCRILVSKLKAAKKFTALKWFPNSLKNDTLRKQLKRPLFLSKDFTVLTNSGLGYIQVHVA